MKQVRNRVRSFLRRAEGRAPLLRQEATPAERRLLDRLKGGLDPEQVGLFADLLLLVKLAEKQQFAKVTKLADTMAPAGQALPAARASWAELQSTYYSRDTLKLLARQYRHFAAVALAEDDDQRLSRITEYLDAGEAFRPLQFGERSSSVADVVHRQILLYVADMDSADIARHKNFVSKANDKQRVMFMLKGSKAHVLEVRRVTKIVSRCRLVATLKNS
jgi:hypothetical protein